MQIPPFEQAHWIAVASAFVLSLLIAYVWVRMRVMPGRLILQEKLAGLEKEIMRQDQALVEQKEAALAAQGHAKSWEVHAAQLQTQLDEELRKATEKAELLNRAEERLSATFKALSADSLRANQTMFFEMAKASFDKLHEAAQGDMEHRKQAIENLVKPVTEQLKHVDEKVQQLEVARATAYAELVEQCRMIGRSHEALSTETRNLVTALRQPKARGQWGEMQLRRVAEFAGMLEHCDFMTEVHIADEDDNRVRPDMIVRLPGNRCVIVDAKTPLEAYLDAAQATDEATRDAALVRHARLVRQHMKQLSSKKYFAQVEKLQGTPEFVVLFLPGEMYFSAALEMDPTLLEADKHVILATPTTLIALLRSVAYSWRQEAIARNAIEVSELGQQLYKHLCIMAQHFERVGYGLNNAVTHYNRCLASLESRVLTSARKFTELGAASDAEVMQEMKEIDAKAQETTSARMTNEWMG